MVPDSVFFSSSASPRFCQHSQLSLETCALGLADENGNLRADNDNSYAPVNSGRWIIIGSGSYSRLGWSMDII